MIENKNVIYLVKENDKGMFLLFRIKNIDCIKINQRNIGIYNKNKFDKKSLQCVI